MRRFLFSSTKSLILLYKTESYVLYASRNRMMRGAHSASTNSTKYFCESTARAFDFDHTENPGSHQRRQVLRSLNNFRALATYVNHLFCV
ncbi:hypothetical protein ACVWWO_000940 [Bradyrhizobium sp. F1.13.1]